MNSGSLTWNAPDMRPSRTFSPTWRKSSVPKVTKISMMPIENPQSPTRSEEHTSELQSRFDLVCRLLLEKKKKIEATSTRLIDLHEELESLLAPLFTAEFVAIHGQPHRSIVPYQREIDRVLTSLPHQSPL